MAVAAAIFLATTGVSAVGGTLTRLVNP